MQNETKNCQNCKKDFVIETEDFAFYEKIKVPPPTFCPECRAIRRMCWRNERSLFKRACAHTGKQVITMFHPQTDVVIYDRDIWWSDQWDPTDFGMEYDFSRPFFHQYKELLAKVPLANLGNTNVVNSSYGNHNADCKDCYLTYASWKNERVSYSRGAVDVKDSLDLYTVEKSEFCYDDAICTKCYKVNHSYNTDESTNADFLWHCKNVQDSVGCMNLRNQNHAIFNKIYAKEEYQKLKKEIDLGSYAKFVEFEKKFNTFRLGFPYKYGNIGLSHNVTGDNIGLSKNVKYGFDIYGEVEDSKYITHAIGLKEGYDGYGFGAGSALMYEGVDSGIKASNQYFAVLTHGCYNTAYTYMCYNSKNLFGCIGIKKGEYCILNKRYSKEDYEKLVPKIIEQMHTMPYVDARGVTYGYGEFFPAELSPFAYNETIAQEYYPKAQNEILREGFFYRKGEDRNYTLTMLSTQLPDHIQDATDDILEEIISCPSDGNELTQCTKAYRITNEELLFLRRNNIPLPRYCPNCRHHARLSKRNPLKLWHRSCMCENKNHKHAGTCTNEFETSYAPDRPETIYCESCYQQEVL